MEGNLCFKIDWASLIVGRKFPSTSFPGGLYMEGRFNGGFFGLRVWGAYIWRGLYMEGLIFGILRYLLAQLYIWLLGLANNTLPVIHITLPHPVIAVYSLV